MTYEHKCENCNAGCAGRHNAEQQGEEISAGPYLILSGAFILLISIVIKRLF